MRTLLVEDDNDIAGNMIDYLEARQHVVDYAYDGAEGERLARHAPYDLYLLDVNLPRQSGFDLCSLIREELGIHAPIIFTTARGELSDKLRGFELGAWDYLVKPFSLAELSARIAALSLRDAQPDDLAVGQMSLNTRGRLLRVGDREQRLPNIAFQLLVRLMKTHPDGIGRDHLVREIWGSEEPDSSPLRSHISDLRKRLRELGSDHEIQAIKGFGFCLLPVAPAR